LSLPREVGLHPETGKPITAGLGRYGPFILHDGTYANLPTVEETFDVGINRAVVLLAEKKAGGGKGRWQRAAPTVLKELGDHPSEGGKVQVLSGRYGPYVKHGDVNATLPRGKEPTTLTMDEAVQLIAERVAKGPSKAKGRRAKTAGKSADAQPAGNGKDKAAQVESQGQGKAKGKSVGTERQRSRFRTPTTVPHKPKEARRPAGLPSKKTSSTFCALPGTKAGKREIARAFSVKGGDRVALKGLLAEMARGPAARQPQGLQGARTLPPVAVLEIVARDADGELIAEPAVWDAAEGERPRVLVLAPAASGRSGEPALGRATASWRG
jgi:hypothetical protein